MQSYASPDVPVLTDWVVQHNNDPNVRIVGRYYCDEDNVDPGAVVCRSEAPIHKEAIQAVVANAQQRLSGSRIRRVV